MKEDQDVQLAGENLAQLQQQLTTLDEEIASAITAIDTGVDAAAVPLETIEIKPKRTQVVVRTVALAWVPE